MRDALLRRKSFLNEYGFEIDPEFGLIGSDIKLKRRKFYATIRRLYKEAKPTLTIRDLNNRNVRVSFVDRNLGVVRFEKKGNAYVLSNLWMLSPDSDLVLANFDAVTKQHAIPLRWKVKWKQRLAQGPLNDDEVDDLSELLQDTPKSVRDGILSDIEKGTSAVDGLIPSSSRYYSLLVGEYDPDLRLAEYAEEVATARLSDLTENYGDYGLLSAFLLSSHPSIVDRINLGGIPPDVILRVWDFLATSGDLISQLGAVEVGIENLPKYPSIEESLVEMVKCLEADDPEAEESRYSLLSSLIVLTDARHSEIGLKESALPYWRRLASIAHASLIERCMIKGRVRLKPMTEWAMSTGAHRFYLQSLCDLRFEPKWTPEFMSAKQLKAEFIGRMLNACKRNSEQLKGTELSQFTSDDGKFSLYRHMRFPFPYLPGPLEGGAPSIMNVPPDIAQGIEEALSAKTIDQSSFAALINSALLFDLKEKWAELAAVAIRSVNHYVKRGDTSCSAFPLIYGLATVAAVTRNEALAEELRPLTWRSKWLGANDLTVDSIFLVGMTASAAHSDKTPWCNSVGSWLSDLAFGDLNADEAKSLHGRICTLCEIVPDLWSTLGRAEAATASLSN